MEGTVTVITVMDASLGQCLFRGRGHDDAFPRSMCSEACVGGEEGCQAGFTCISVLDNLRIFVLQ